MGLWDTLSGGLDRITAELVPDAAASELELAQTLLTKGEASEALVVVEKILMARAQHAAARLIKIEALSVLGRHDESRMELEQLAAERPSDPRLSLLRGSLALGAGDAVSARDHFQAAFSGAGGAQDILAQAFAGLGFAHRALGEPGSAARALRKALALAAAPSVALALGELALSGHAPPEDALIQLDNALSRVGGDVSSRAWLVKGRLAATTGRNSDAALALDKALLAVPDTDSAARAEILSAMIDLEVATGDTAAAETHLDQALSVLPGDPELARRRAGIALRRGDPDAALAAWLDASARDASVAALAVPVALERDARAHVAALAAQPHTTPWHELARAVHALREGRVEPTVALLAAWPTTLPPFERACLESALALAEDRPADAVRASDAAGRAMPGSGRVRKLATAALQKLVGTPRVDDPLSRIDAFLRAAPWLPGISVEATTLAERARGRLGRPLRLVVMGEFSAGKSTFVNTFAGAALAPIGATPTTGVIHVLTHGAELSARIHKKDGTVSALPPAELATLAKLDARTARDIAWVEIQHPLPVLAQVHVIDTPGLNSLSRDHERTARDFLAEADAIIWLFSAAQAGKLTEKEALETARAAGQPILGVLNKCDQLTAPQRKELVAYLTRELGSLLHEVVPLSAKDAFDARMADDSKALKSSGWTRVESALDEHFLQKAKDIQHEHATRLFGQALDRAAADLQMTRSVAQTHLAHLQERSAQATAARQATSTELVPALSRTVARAWSDAYRRAGDELLSLLRPRRQLFGGGEVASADRDFLQTTLRGSLARVLVDARRTVEDALHAEPAPPGDIAPVATVLDPVFAAAHAYVRGLLDGGRLDHFFEVVLPKIELGSEPIYHALYRHAPDPDKELLAPLDVALAQHAASRADAWNLALARASLALFRAGTLAPLALAPLTREPGRDDTGG